MRIKISEGNTKIGRVPNLNLPPGLSCVKGIPCFTDGCYAKQSYIQYPNVRKAWDSNLEFYSNDPDKYFYELLVYLRKKEPKLFRVHSSGDIVNDQYWEMLCAAVSSKKTTNFLIFTKRYDLDFSLKPDNMSLYLSTWPGLALPDNDTLPRTWLEEDPRKPETYFRCKGGCDDCGHQCWKMEGVDVVFKRH